MAAATSSAVSTRPVETTSPSSTSAGVTRTPSG